MGWSSGFSRFFRLKAGLKPIKGRLTAHQFAGVVELDLLGPAQIPPARAEESQDLVPLAGLGQAQAHGPVEDILADPDLATVPAAVEVDGSERSTSWSSLAARACGPGHSWRGSSGARRTRGAVKPLRWSTRSMVRGLGRGRASRALSSAKMADAPMRLYRVASVAWACSRRWMERIALSSSGAIRWARCWVAWVRGHSRITSSLLRLHGYRWGLAAAGKSVGYDMIGRFFRENRGREVSQVRQAMAEFFLPYKHMVRPVVQGGGENPMRGTLEDNRAGVCFGTSTKRFLGLSV
jgi:hypothetical protein